MEEVTLGNGNGNFKHGLYTREAKTARRIMRATIREIKALIQAATRAQWAIEATGNSRC